MAANWIRKEKGWLKRYTTSQPADSDNGAVETEPSPEDLNCSVVFVALRCPKCNGKDIRTYASKLPVRYHKCAGCGLRFKSCEQV